MLSDHSYSSISSSRGTVLLTVCLGAFMATLDTSIVNIALPQIAREFHSSLEQISWVMVIYLLVNVSLLLTSGRLGDMLAPGRLFLLGLAIFAGASVLCGLSKSLSWLLASRALQGLGGSLMLGMAPKIIALTYGEGERGLALGWFSTAFAAGISVGAPLGGLITAYLGWPYIFFINIPIGLLAWWWGWRALRRLRAQSAWDWRSLDLWGGLTLAGALVMFILTLNRVRAVGEWHDRWILGGLGGAAALFILLIRGERRQPAPLLHGALWGSWPFIAGSVVVVLTFAAVMGTFFLLPFLLDRVYHYPPDQAGLMMAALSVTNAAVAPLGGYLADRLGNLIVLRTGSTLILLGLGSLVFTSPASSTWQLTGRLALIGLGFGLFQAPNLNEILRGVRPVLIGLAASTNAVLKNLGSLVGITMMVMVLAWINVHHLSLRPGGSLELGSFHAAFAVTAGLAAINLLANLLPRSHERPTAAGGD